MHVRAGGVVLGLAIAFAVTHAWGQEPAARRTVPGLWPAAGGTSPGVLQESGPRITAYPAELLGLLAPPAERGPITLRPSISLSEEYNDNVSLDNRARQSDFITRFSPALTLTVNQPAYQLSAGYTLSGELHANRPESNDMAKSHVLVATALYRGTRGLTVTASDSFMLSRSTDQVATQGFATGGDQQTWNNAFTSGLTWEMTPRTSLNVTGTFSMQRFLAAEGGSTSESQTSGSQTPGSDSNTYGLQTSVEHTLTRRLTGTVGYGFTYLDFLGEQASSATHNPTLGLRYVVTPTLTVSASAGPSMTHLAGETSLSWGGTLRLLQIFQIGSVSLEYTRGVSTAGGVGGTTQTDTVSGGLLLPSWYRGLIVAFTPTYRTATSLGGQGSEVDLKTLTVPLSVSYQLARYTSVFAEYTFFRQRSGTSSSAQAEVDQNSLRFGLQFGYPFNFD